MLLAHVSSIPHSHDGSLSGVSFAVAVAAVMLITFAIVTFVRRVTRHG
jgi:hypothetical protein